jgi:hypothetical protein
VAATISSGSNLGHGAITGFVLKTSSLVQLVRDALAVGHELAQVGVDPLQEAGDLVDVASEPDLVDDARELLTLRAGCRRHCDDDAFGFALARELCDLIRRAQDANAVNARVQLRAIVINERNRGEP